MGLKECLEYIRDNFEKKYADNISNGLYDKRDLDRLKTDEPFAKQYIRGRDRLDEGVDLIHASFKFRHEMKLNDVNEDTFTQDLWEVGGMYFFRRDFEGNRIYYLNVRCHRRDSPEERQHAEKLGLVFGLERAFRENPHQPIVVLLDMSSTGVANLDLDFVKYILTCFKYYFPTFLSYFLIYDMPWIFNAAWKVIKQMLSAEAQAKIKFVSKGNVQDFITADNLPVHMGGQCDEVYEYYYGICSVPLYPEDVEETTPTPQKKVTFQETISPTLEKNDTDINSNASNVNNNAQDAAIMEGMKGNGHFLIRPPEELYFEIPDTGEDALEMITLTNNMEYPTAFKVKTTSPEKYRVKPSAGFLVPGASETVHVFLVNEMGDNVTKDKFLVMAADATGKDEQDYHKVWKDIPRDKISEHRLRCVAVRVQGPVGGAKKRSVSSKRRSSDSVRAPPMEKMHAEKGHLHPHQTHPHQTHSPVPEHPQIFSNMVTPHAVTPQESSSKKPSTTSNQNPFMQFHSSGIASRHSVDDQSKSPYEPKRPLNADDVDILVERLEQQNEHMQRQLNLLLVIQLATAIFFLLIMFSYSCFGEELFTRFLALPFDFCGDKYGRKC